MSINEGKVKEILASLKIDKSPGPDGIHNRELYENREQVLVPLTETLRNSFETGKELQEVIFFKLSSQGILVGLKETPLDIEQSTNGINTLSNSVVSSENINQFKTRQESFWETQEFKYDPSIIHDN